MAGGYQVFKWAGTNWSSQPGGAVDISVGPDGTPWVVNSNHQGFAMAAASGGCVVTQPMSLANPVKTKIDFLNNAIGPVQLYWLNSSGHLVYYATIAAGASVGRKTFDAQAWVLLATNLTCVGYVIAPAPYYNII